MAQTPIAAFETYQVADVLTSLLQDMTGTTDVVNQDLSNLQDFGSDYQSLFDSSRQSFIGGLVTRITNTIMIQNGWKSTEVDLEVDMGDPLYTGIIQTVRMRELSLEDNNIHDTEPGTFDNPYSTADAMEFETKYWANNYTYTLRTSVSDRWYKGFFKDAAEFAEFLGLIESEVQRTIKKAKDASNRGTLLVALASIVKNGGVESVQNLFMQFLNTQPELLADDTYTPEVALTDPEFFRFAANRFKIIDSYLSGNNKLFNSGGWLNASSDMHKFIHSQFLNATGHYLLADVFNQERIYIPEAKEVTEWQGVGVSGLSFDKTSAVNVTFKQDGENYSFNKTGIIGAFFDKRYAATYGYSHRHYTKFNEANEVTNQFHHIDMAGKIDDSFDGVIFIMEDTRTTGTSASVLGAKIVGDSENSVTNPLEVEVIETEITKADVIDLEELSTTELKALAKERGKKGYSKLNKEELKKLLKDLD